MKLSEVGVIDLYSSGPYCPNSTTPIHPAHALRDGIDAVMEAAIPRDDEGEPLDATGASVLTGLGTDWRTAQRMRLYRDVVSAVDHDDRLVAVEALYFKCGICGLILPANRVS